MEKTNEYQTLVLYRPVGQPELDLIAASGYTAFPPRLAWQPIFYPVLDRDYACRIAREWNTNDEANGNVGYVTRFEVDKEYVQRFEVQNVGAHNHNELWVPAEELDNFNRHIIGNIEVIETFRNETVKQQI